MLVTDINIYFFFLKLLFSSKFYEYDVVIRYENEASQKELSFSYLDTIPHSKNFAEKSNLRKKKYRY